ncbi:MocR-like pyridoxine biosynthesis transcription factor PdxR [Rhizobium alvei]|uniref:PLP-dependent aminotransferase family protein n=1 Tax=Rhizobium alvei TaxID=1132659 RepID=A0ABT8YI16_9HYPH|nr:PLP-dependent aminotransferase family protein [Rhizobium alvei]MDO6963330.1 PLP-dependent aminotransferase family protein [Rhizobium alvei]
MEKKRTNPIDWSLLIPVLPEEGPRRIALYQALRRLIESGQLPPGAKLPTTRDLAGRLGVSRGAAVASFEMLLADGFVEARTGAGTFVADAVPLLARPKPDERMRAGLPEGALPGTLGVSMADEQTMAAFRNLLMKDLARPGAAHFTYGDSRGGWGLRNEVANYLRAARGVRCHPDQILLTAGTQQALDFIMRGAMAPGDAIWMEDPGYPMAHQAFRAAGMRVVGVPVDGEGIDIAAGERIAPDARVAYVTPSHQFPLGVTLSMRRRLALIEWARRADAFIIEDDYDSEFRFAGPPLSSLQGIDGEGRVIYVGSFSKALFPGLRVGYAVLPERLVDPILAVRFHSDRFPSTLVEAPLARFIAEGHFARHLRRARRKARVARDALVAALSGSAVTVHPPDQGLHLIALSPEDVEDHVLEAAARHAGLGGRKLSSMYVDAEPRHGMVLGYSGFAPQVLADAATRWRHALETGSDRISR